MRRYRTSFDYSRLSHGCSGAFSMFSSTHLAIHLSRHDDCRVSTSECSSAPLRPKRVAARDAARRPCDLIPKLPLSSVQGRHSKIHASHNWKASESCVSVKLQFTIEAVGCILCHSLFLTEAAQALPSFTSSMLSLSCRIVVPIDVNGSVFGTWQVAIP